MPMSETSTNTRKISKKQPQKPVEELEPNLELYKMLEPMNLPPLLRTQAK